jgi:hypothetical protein
MPRVFDQYRFPARTSAQRHRSNGIGFLSVFFVWAHFRRFAPETGLSTPIFLPVKRARSISVSIPCAGKIRHPCRILPVHFPEFREPEALKECYGEAVYVTVNLMQLLTVPVSMSLDNRAFQDLVRVIPQGYFHIVFIGIGYTGNGFAYRAKKRLLFRIFSIYLESDGCRSIKDRQEQ